MIGKNNRAQTFRNPRPPILVSPNTIHADKYYTVKVHVLNGHGTFRILVLAFEIGDFE